MPYHPPIPTDHDSWGVFLTDAGRYEIQRVDVADVFSSDEEAVEFVHRQALKGDPKALEAALLHNTTPADWQHLED